MLRIIIFMLCIASVHNFDYEPCDVRQEYNYEDVKPGKRGKQERTCGTNCSYTYSVNGEARYMPCSIEACRDPEISNEAPLCPWISGITFIKFGEKGKRRIALKVSWSAPDFSMIKYPEGYCVDINDTLNRYTGCYYFNQTMDYINRKDIFENDCFLPSQSKRKPLYPISIAITSLPLKSDGPSQTRNILIKVPERGSGVVEKVCKNFSVVYQYSIKDPNFGSEANVSICSVNSNGRCHRNKKISQTQLNATGTLYNLSVPGPPDYNASYRIFLYGKSGDPLAITTFNFSGCLLEKPSTSFTATIVIFPLVTIAIVVIAIAICQILRAKNRRKDYHKNESIHSSLEALELSSLQDSSGSNTTRETPISSIALSEDAIELPGTDSEPADQNNPRLFVMFTNDNDLHTNAVMAFCNYLQQGLGLCVKVAAWDETGEYVANSNSYIIQNLDSADKVLLICSARTKNCLVDKDDAPERDVLEFTFAVNFALNERNFTKFLVCYFNYSTEDCIPSTLAKIYRTHYRLMNEFKGFYFHMMELEEYLEDRKINFDLDGVSHSNETLKKLWGNLKHCMERVREMTISTHTKQEDLITHQPPRTVAIVHATYVSIQEKAHPLESTASPLESHHSGIVLSETASGGEGNVQTDVVEANSANGAESCTEIRTSHMLPCDSQARGVMDEVIGDQIRSVQLHCARSPSEAEMIETALKIALAKVNNSSVHQDNVSNCDVIHGAVNNAMAPEWDTHSRESDVALSSGEVPDSLHWPAETIPKSVYMGEDESSESHAWNSLSSMEYPPGGSDESCPDINLINTGTDVIGERSENGPDSGQRSGVSLEVQQFLEDLQRQRGQRSGVSLEVQQFLEDLQRQRGLRSGVSLEVQQFLEDLQRWRGQDFYKK